MWVRLTAPVLTWTSPGGAGTRANILPTLLNNVFVQQVTINSHIPLTNGNSINILVVKKHLFKCLEALDTKWRHLLPNGRCYNKHILRMRTVLFPFLFSLSDFFVYLK